MATAAKSSTSTMFVSLLAIGATLGGSLFGFDTSTMNSAINGFQVSLELDNAQVGFITAIALIGSAAGAWFAGSVSERFGHNSLRSVSSAGVS